MKPIVKAKDRLLTKWTEVAMVIAIVAIMLLILLILFR